MKRLSPLVIGVAGLTVLSIVALSAFVWGDAPPPAPTPAASTPTAAVASSTPTASPHPTASAAPSPSPLSAGVHENQILGYRITLPAEYRLDRSLILHGRDALGNDLFTRQTVQQAREECLRDSGDVGTQAQRIGDIRVGVYRNARNVSAFEWATTPQSPGGQPRSVHHNVERTTVAGHDAVRLVEDNPSAFTTMFVIRAGDRLYEIGLESWPIKGASKSYLDEIVRTFDVISAAPFPSPTATTPPRDAAGRLAEGLRDAFAARDAGAVTRLLPDCWLAVYPLINGEPPGGVLLRSVGLFSQALRDRFAMGDLTVTVDTTLEPDSREEGAFIVRSEWTEPDRTTRIDLHLGERQGAWRWRLAVHHGDWPCRSPWVTTASC